MKFTARLPYRSLNAALELAAEVCLTAACRDNMKDFSVPHVAMLLRQAGFGQSGPRGRRRKLNNRKGSDE